jgi:hypothetical protein
MTYLFQNLVWIVTHSTQKIADHLKKDQTKGGLDGSCIIYYCDSGAFDFDAWEEVKIFNIVQRYNKFELLWEVK